MAEPEPEPDSLTSWLLAGSGHRMGAIGPPPHGRAPGWHAGLTVAARDLAGSVGFAGDAVAAGATQEVAVGAGVGLSDGVDVEAFPAARRRGVGFRRLR
jgi:hypothetical protein